MKTIIFDSVDNAALLSALKELAQGVDVKIILPDADLIREKNNRLMPEEIMMDSLACLSKTFHDEEKEPIKLTVLKNRSQQLVESVVTFGYLKSYENLQNL